MLKNTLYTFHLYYPPNFQQIYGNMVVSKEQGCRWILHLLPRECYYYHIKSSWLFFLSWRENIPLEHWEKNHSKSLKTEKGRKTTQGYLKLWDLASLLFFIMFIVFCYKLHFHISAIYFGQDDFCQWFCKYKIF